jgi:hypothetical protein
MMIIKINRGSDNSNNDRDHSGDCVRKHFWIGCEYKLFCTSKIVEFEVSLRWLWIFLSSGIWRRAPGSEASSRALLPARFMAISWFALQFWKCRWYIAPKEQSIFQRTTLSYISVDRNLNFWSCLKYKAAALVGVVRSWTQATEFVCLVFV